MFHHHSTDEGFLAAHADVDALLQRLARDITTLEDRGDRADQQALADAGERYETAGAQFGKAHTTGELSVVRSIVVEGLQATRLVRTHQGLDPGSDPTAPAVVEPAGDHPSGHSWADRLAHSKGGLGSAVGAGAAGGILGLIGGGLVGELLGGGDGGDWDGEGGGWGGGDMGGGD